jgi:protein-disulfide isomerase
MCLMHEENKKHIIQRFFSHLTTQKAIVIAGALIAGAILVSQIFFNSSSATDEIAAKITSQGGSDLLHEVNDKEDFIRGAKNPKITIVEFSDFGCGFCASFHPTLKQIVEKYPNDVAWVYRHLPYRNNEAALASECVGQELGDEAFWQYSEALFSKFPDITNDVLVEEAIKLGFKSEEAFWECQSSEKVAKAVDDNSAEARLLGASGTPYSIIVTKDGETFPLKGATPFAQVDKIISLLIEQ